MSVLFARVVPVWMILFALIALLAPPFGATTGLMQLLSLALAVSAVLAFMVFAVLGPVPHRYTPHGRAVAVLPSIDVDSRIAVTPVLRKMLKMVVSAGARFWHVNGVPVAIPRRARAGSDVRVPSYLGNRSPGQASRGLGGLRDGSRWRAPGRPPML